jgi:signal transduction histidine kinase
VVVDREGRSVADSDAPDDGGADFTNRPEIMTALGGRRAEGSRRSETLGDDLVYVALPVASGGVVHGAVRITYPSSTLDARVRAVWLGLGLVSVLVLAVVTVVGLALARLVTRPVTRIADAARRVARGDLTARAPTDDGAPELRELASTFNETAARLEEMLATQEGFVADASHQLRTPLAALRLQLENLEAAVPLDVQPALAAARAETARLARISNALLTLTRSTEAAAAGRRQPVDAAAVVADRVARWAPVAAGTDVTLEASGPPHSWVQAVPGDLEQVLDNLIDNALEASPAGSVVRVTVEAGDDRVDIHVIDQGPGLREEDRHRAFDRFWRAPDAPPGGTGLGLSIVAQLAVRDGGRAELRPGAEGSGLDAVVVLPATAPGRDG